MEKEVVEIIVVGVMFVSGLVFLYKVTQ